MAYFICASLFPSPVTPYTGLFVKHRLNALRQCYPSDTPFFIVSPTPYFPFKQDCFKSYALYAQKPSGIVDYDGFKIAYPRYAQIPLTNSRFSGYFTYVSIKKYFDYFVKNYGKPKILIAEYGFPDCLAIYELSKIHKIPYVVTVRGSDVSYFMKLDAIKDKMLNALNHAQTIITVSHTLKQELHDVFNIPLEKITVIGNGVDSRIFHQKPNHTLTIREEYNIQTQYLLCSVGGLIKRKNHSLAVDAMAFLPNHSLLIVGTGEESDNLKAQIKALNLETKVFLCGANPQETLADIYNSSDLFLLCSLSEGRPNVVLESLACGTPALSATVQGVDELIINDNYGKIIDMKRISPQSLANNIITLTQTPFDKKMIETHGHQFSWENSARLYKQVLLP